MNWSLSDKLYIQLWHGAIFAYFVVMAITKQVPVDQATVGILFLFGLSAPSTLGITSVASDLVAVPRGPYSAS